MKAILLAGGYGTRLRPLTDHTPKCLVPIKGRPLLDIWIENLIQSGISSILINTHYLPDQVEAYVKTSVYQKYLTCVYEPELLGTAGTIRNNFDFWKDERDLFVAHADNLCRCDFKAFEEAHQTRPEICVLTMMTFHAQHPENCGIITQNEQGIVTHFHEKQQNPPGHRANGAVYWFNTTFLKTLTTQNDLSTEVLPHLMGRILTWHNTDLLVDIGTPEMYNLYVR